MVLYAHSFNENEMWFRTFLPLLPKPKISICVFNFGKLSNPKTEFQLNSKQFPRDCLNKTYE